MAQVKQILKVDKSKEFRGARKAWYDRLVKYDGKDLAEFVEDVTKDRPSCYGKNSSKAGAPEPVQGWVRYFFREGVARTVNRRV